MLVVLLCCMMKFVESVVGKPEPRKKKTRCRRRIPKDKKGKAMAEVAVVGRGTALTPDSDCNSNHPGSASCLSNTSSQDIDFIQDNSDYQWFLDYGYRDNNHTSILSLGESYDASDIGYYDALAKNMDANLAEADMESFRTEDIHALLTNLPPMCTDHLSQENNRQGESYASVSGSIMAKFDFDSPHTSSQGEDSANSTSMSICKSELLFSPVKENPMLDANFSVDSLDCELLNEHDIMLTCQANKDNYTIAFEGSMAMYSEDSDFHETDKSEMSAEECANWTRKLKKKLHNMRLDQSMTRSDCSSLTTWSKLKKRTCESQLRRLPSGNNNESSDEASCNANDVTMKSQSMPNLTRNRLNVKLNKSLIMQNMSCSSSESSTVRRRPVKVFDIQNQMQLQHNSTNGMSELSDMATSIDAGSTTSSDHSGKQNFSLVKLFMKQKSMSAEGMSTALDNSSTSDNWPGTQSSDSNISEKPQVEAPISRSNDVIVETEEAISKKEDISLRTESKDIRINVNNNNSSMETRKDFKSKGTNTKRLNSLGISISSESSNSSIIQSEKRSKISKCVPLKLINKSMQTSVSEIFKNPPYKLTGSFKERIKVVEPSFLNKLKEKSEVAKPVYILYPSYALPNLDFLNNKEEDIANILLMPQQVNTAPTPAKRRPFSCNDFDALKKKGFGHIQDWESLNVLLPKELRTILADVPEVAHHFANKRDRSNWKDKTRPMSCDYGLLDRGTSLDKTSSSSSTATQPSSGYRGSSTLLTDSQNSPNLNPLFVYRYDSVTSSEASSTNNDRPSVMVTAPPLPKRSISLSGDVPPRPPLPRSILRKGIENKIINNNKKRYSLIETNEEISENVNKRSSLHEPYYFPRNKRLSETEDEGVDAGTSSSSFDEQERMYTPPPQSNINPLFNNLNYEDIYQLEEFLKLSGVSLSEADSEESITQLRSYVAKFLSLKMNQDNSKKVSFAPQKNFVPNNSPNVSALLNRNQTKTLVDMPICEEGETSPENYSPHSTPQKYDVNQKRHLVETVADSVERLIQHFSPATNQNELNVLGDSELNPACAKLALNTLCPALYTLLSDGLKTSLETSFGAINNSVWQVVEASAQQGPLTKALNELVMRINSEDTLSEGLVKFNAFVFGLLNVRSLDAWMSYLRTRESIIKKHYNANSLLVLSLTGSITIRGLLDTLIAALQPLALLPFQFDLLFEYRQLHESLRRMDSYHHPTSPIHKVHKYSTYSFSGSDTDEVSAETAIHNSPPNADDQGLPDLLNSSRKTSIKVRPRSCIDPGCYTKPGFKLGEDVASIAKKRWSGVSLTSKLYQAYNRLALDSEEEYTDSLETHHHHRQPPDEDATQAENLPADAPESLESVASDDKPLNGKKFKKLQRKWEMLSGKEVDRTPPESPTHPKSKIPRPVMSPVRPSGIPIPISPTGRGKGLPNKIPTPVSGAIKKIPMVTQKIASTNLVKNGGTPNKRNIQTARTSRLDQLENNTASPRTIPRPSSLPYKPATQAAKNSKITPPRRAVSTSVTRKTTTQTPKVVKTLSHRLPSESGHLPYNEGERLRVVLEVDEQWLLCCRGTQKGLVPRSAVIPADSGRF